MSDVMRAKYVLEYGYRRSTGPVIGQFFTGLRDGRIEGAKTASGRVIVPPTEYDPDTGDAIVGLVPVGSSGVVTTWAWVGEPKAGQPLATPFAWALVKLDGADTAMLHAVSVASPDQMKTGMRVTARWKAERTGVITDIEAFVPEEAT